VRVLYVLDDSGYVVVMYWMIVYVVDVGYVILYRIKFFLYPTVYSLRYHGVYL
jgi:hypothetical protein